MSDPSQPQTALLMQESVLSSKSKSSMAANAPILSGGVTTQHLNSPNGPPGTGTSSAKGPNITYEIKVKQCHQHVPSGTSAQLLNRDFEGLHDEKMQPINPAASPLKASSADKLEALDEVNFDPPKSPSSNDEYLKIISKPSSRQDRIYSHTQPIEVESNNQRPFSAKAKPATMIAQIEQVRIERAGETVNQAKGDGDDS